MEAGTRLAYASRAPDDQRRPAAHLTRYTLFRRTFGLDVYYDM